MSADEYLGYDEQRRELARLRTELATATERLTTVEADLKKERRRTKDLRTQATVDADRCNHQMAGHLHRVLAELVRRGVATDLIPDWWRDSWNCGSRDEADMRADWPEPLVLAERCRELAEALRAAERREEKAHRRRHAAESSRDDWRDEAITRGYTPPRGPSLGDPDIRTQYDTDLHARDEVLRAAERREARARAVQGRADGLAAFIRRLTKLPVAPKKLGPELFAVAAAIAPRNGQPVALPPDVVSEVCRLAAESLTFDLVRQYELNGVALDDDEVLAAHLRHYGLGASQTPSPTKAAAPSAPAESLFDLIDGGGA